MNQRGFTLAEIVIAMAVAAILMAGTYTVFASQQRIGSDQQRIVDMQQNLRSTLTLLQSEIRMAGFDPSWSDAGGDGQDDRRLADGIDNDCDAAVDLPADADEHLDCAGIIKAGAHRIQIRLDRDGNSDFCGSQELVEFGFAGSSDRNRDGIADQGVARLNRGFKDRALNQPVGENLQAVGFAYAFDGGGPAGRPDGKIDTVGEKIIWAYDADGDGQLDTALDADKNGIIDAADDLDGDGVLNDWSLDRPVALASIRAVRVWLLGRTPSPVRLRSQPRTYTVGSRILTSPAADGCRRMLISGIIFCRNLGLR